MRRRLSGSFTVEASLIMPMVLLVIFGLITFSLWQRDMVMVQAKMIESVQSARSLSAEQGEQILHNASKRTLYSSFGTAGPDNAGKKISVSVAGSPKGIYEGLHFHFSGSFSRADYNPVSFMRKCALAQSLINR